MIVNRRKMNLINRLKRIEDLYKDLSKVMEEDLGSLEQKFDQLESKLFRFEDRLTMLECKTTEKN